MLEGQDVSVGFIPVTESDAEERLRKENLDVEELQKNIFLEIENLGEDECKLMNDYFNKLVRGGGGSKEKYIAFLAELQNDM